MSSFFVRHCTGYAKRRESRTALVINLGKKGLGIVDAHSSDSGGERAKRAQLWLWRTRKGAFYGRLRAKKRRMGQKVLKGPELIHRRVVPKARRFLALRLGRRTKACADPVLLFLCGLLFE